MGKLKLYDGVTFYGSSVGGENPIPGLRKEIRHGKQNKSSYSYVVFSDDAGIKWKIIPVLNRKGSVGSLKLFHRNSKGCKGFHSQRQPQWGTTQGIVNLAEYIRRHE